MIRQGILWKVRTQENEIALSEERGCRTYSCLSKVFSDMRTNEIREGCYVHLVFDTRKRLVRKVELIVLEGYVTKWAPRYAFVLTPIVPQIKLSSNKRVAECKFLQNPPTSLSSTYISPTNVHFKLENNQRVSFSLCVNLKVTRTLRNPPYLDLTAINVELSSEQQKSNSPVQEGERLNDWFSRRMSSPREPPKTPPRKFINTRQRGHSSPQHLQHQADKRDPVNSKYKGPSYGIASAPVTPLHPVEDTEDLPENYNDMMAVFKNPIVNEPTSNQIPSCLRCTRFDTVCHHRPPKVQESSDASPRNFDGVKLSPRMSLSRPEGPTKSQATYLLEQEKREREKKERENSQLRNELAQLRLQLQQQSEAQNKKVVDELSLYPMATPDVNRLEDVDKLSQNPVQQHRLNSDISFHNYENIFSQSPSVSCSPSPEPEHFQDPSSLPFLYDGKPSSTRSDILNLEKKLPYIPTAPLVSTGVFPSKYEYSISDTNSMTSNSITSSRSWATNSDQLHPREYHDEYYERRQSPRDMEQILSVTPLSQRGLDSRSFRPNPEGIRRYSNPKEPSIYLKDLLDETMESRMPESSYHGRPFQNGDWSQYIA